MIILAMDVETTGLDSSVDEITEFAGVLWDVNRKNFVYTYTTLVQGGKAIPPHLVELTGIDNEMREEFGTTSNECALGIASLLERADCCMAHNALFDRGFIEALFKKHNYQFPADKTWIDTKSDIPQKGRSSSLVYACADHGFVNPFPHRALHDVFSMLKLASHYDMREALEFARSPYALLMAEVSYEERDKAKSAGFHWDGKRKAWTMRVRVKKMETMDFKKFGFRVSYLLEDEKQAEHPIAGEKKEVMQRKAPEPASDEAFDEGFAERFGRR